MSARKRLHAAVLLAGGAVVALALAEVAVRIVAPQSVRFQTPGMYLPDSAVGYRFTPNYSGEQSNRLEYRVAIRTDENGLRIPAAPRSATRPRRVLLIGDSFVFGQGVEAEEALAVQLEHQLETRGESVTVINAGVPGYSTRDEVSWLRRYGMDLHPDLVIIGIYLGNDLQDNRIAAVQRFLNGTVTRPPRRWHSVITQWTYDHLHLYALARAIPEAWRASRRVHGMRADVAATVERFRPGTDAVYQEEIAETNKAIADFASVLSVTGTPGFAVLIPEALQADPARIAAFTSQLPDSVKVDLAFPNSVFSRALDESRIPWTDLTTPLREATAGGASLYFQLDGHWNQAGNARAAELVADALMARRDRVLLPAAQRLRK